MEDIAFEKEKINRYFNGEYSDEDIDYVDKAFRCEEKEKELMSLLSSQFDGLSPEDDLDKKDLDHILYKIHYEINTRLTAQKGWSINNVIKWTFRIAGILTLPLAIFFIINTRKEVSLKKVAWVEINAPAWSRVQFSLPDGTKGWLNSNSNLKYNEYFNSDRQISLKGEAFFDVFKDNERPFKVNTNEVIATVLGTRFNISSYENEKNVEVVLEEGKLIFQSKGINKPYVMKPNDLITYNKTLNDYSVEVVQSQKYVSWTEGKLVFRNDPLDVITRRLGRWYNIDVEIEGNFTDDLRWHATFKDESLEEVLSLMKRSLSIDYRIENSSLKPDTIYLKRKVIITLKAK